MNLKIFIAITFLILLGFTGYLERSNVKNTTINKSIAKEGYGYGLGVERFPTLFGESFGHTGTAYGFVTLMAYLPNKDTTVIVLLNDQDVDIKAIAMKAVELVNSR